MEKLLLALLLSGMLSFAKGQILSGPELIDRAIAFHDPEGQWNVLNAHFLVQSIRPGEQEVTHVFQLRNGENFFQLIRAMHGKEVLIRVDRGACYAEINGNPQLSSEEIESFQLQCDQILFLRNYHLYTLGLPMKLLDPGAIIQEKAQVMLFQDQVCYEVKVEYEPEVGTDVWYFYVNPNDYSLSGCRFHPVDQPDKGEYIRFQDWVSIGKLRLPKIRSWYAFRDDSYLGTDEILGELVGSP